MIPQDLLLLESIDSGQPLDLSQTRASKRTDRIITRTEKKLHQIITQIQSEFKQTNIYLLKQKYEKQVHDLIRFTIEDAYFEGLDYSDKALNERQPVTVKDIERLNQLTQDAERRFWAIVLKLDKVREFSFSMVLSLISTIISNMVTKSLNTATLANIEPINPIDYSSQMQVIFKTREDEKVCPICEPLNNNVYDINDAGKPDIPDDTHHNCRCRYLVYQDGKELAG